LNLPPFIPACLLGLEPEPSPALELRFTLWVPPSPQAFGLRFESLQQLPWVSNIESADGGLAFHDHTHGFSGEH
jgi:hypothetical protein